MKHALTHFGLADATAIDSVEIRWPSGAIDVLKNLQADKFYSVLEGKGVVPPPPDSFYCRCPIGFRPPSLLHSLKFLFALSKAFM